MGRKFRRGKTRTRKNRMRKQLNRQIPRDQRAKAHRVLMYSKQAELTEKREQAAAEILAGMAEDQEPIKPEKPKPVRSDEDGRN